MHFERQLEHSLRKAGHTVNWLPSNQKERRQELNGHSLEQVLEACAEPLRADNTTWASHDYRIWNR